MSSRSRLISNSDKSSEELKIVRVYLQQLRTNTAMLVVYSLRRF